MKLKVFTKSKISDLLHDQNIQISGNTIIELDSFVERLVLSAVKDIKINENVKRVNGETIVAYIIKNMKSKQRDEKSCLKCYGINKIWLDLSRQIQAHVIDEAKVALTSLKKDENYVK